MWAVLALVALAGCSHTYEKREVNYANVPVERTMATLPDAQLLDVRIKSFEPGAIPEDKDRGAGLSRDIRKAEGYYCAVQLRKTMQGTGYWGAVRVVPSDYTGGDLLVTGKVLASDGEILRLQVRVADATGAEWFTRTYRGVVDSKAYDEARSKGEDPFAFLYTRISNDIADYRKKLEPKQLEEIRQVAELRFAADFAPDAFKGYVREKKPGESGSDGFFGGLLSAIGASDGGTKDGGKAVAPEKGSRYEIVRLPAKDDPMMARVRRVRAREDMVVDALDQEYEGLSRQMQDAYTQWRSSRLTEMNAIREVEDRRDAQVGRSTAIAFASILAAVAVGSSCRNCGTVAGAAGGAVAATAIQNAIQASNQATADRKLHKAALEEIGQSLSSDVEPVVVSVEGQTVELRGSAEEKFRQWREVMKRLYRQEVGPAADRPAPSTSGDRAAPGKGAS